MTQSPSGTIRPVSSATGMNSAGGSVRARVVPAQQGLEGAYLHRMQIDQRLEEQPEVTLDEGVA